jgi:hypothetical protein
VHITLADDLGPHARPQRPNPQNLKMRHASHTDDADRGDERFQASTMAHSTKL